MQSCKINVKKPKNKNWYKKKDNLKKKKKIEKKPLPYNTVYKAHDNIEEVWLAFFWQQDLYKFFSVPKWSQTETLERKKITCLHQ